MCSEAKTAGLACCGKDFDQRQRCLVYGVATLREAPGVKSTRTVQLINSP